MEEIDEISDILFEEGDEAPSQGSTHTYTGVAASDSEGGAVYVRPVGEVVSYDGGGAVRMSCVPAVKKGQRVIVSNVDGSPIVTGAVGWGDDVEIANLRQLMGVAWEYAENYSSTGPPTSGWTSSRPEQTADNVIWRRQVSTRADGTTVTGVPEVDSAPAGRDGEDAVSVQMVSTNGTAFKNSAITTVLEVTVFRGGRRIETAEALRAEFGAGAYLEWSWKPLGGDGMSVISSADPRLSRGGFALALTPQDIDVQAVFACDLMV